VGETVSNRGASDNLSSADRREPGFLHGNGLKPKGMHWRTFERLQASHDTYMAVSLAEMSRMLGTMKSRLNKLRRG